MCWERHQVAVIHQEEEGIYCLRKGASVGLVGWESLDLNGGGQWRILWNESYSYMNLPGMGLTFLEGTRDDWDDVAPTESGGLSLDSPEDDEKNYASRQIPSLYQFE